MTAMSHKSSDLSDVLGDVDKLLATSTPRRPTVTSFKRTPSANVDDLLSGVTIKATVSPTEIHEQDTVRISDNNSVDNITDDAAPTLTGLFAPGFEPVKEQTSESPIAEVTSEPAAAEENIEEVFEENSNSSADTLLDLKIPAAVSQITEESVLQEKEPEVVAESALEEVFSAEEPAAQEAVESVEPAVQETVQEKPVVLEEPAIQETVQEESAQQEVPPVEEAATPELANTEEPVKLESDSDKENVETEEAAQPDNDEKEIEGEEPVVLDENITGEASPASVDLSEEPTAEMDVEKHFIGEEKTGIETVPTVLNRTVPETVSGVKNDKDEETTKSGDKKPKPKIMPMITGPSLADTYKTALIISCILLFTVTIGWVYTYKNVHRQKTVLSAQIVAISTPNAFTSCHSISANDTKQACYGRANLQYDNCIKLCTFNKNQETCQGTCRQYREDCEKQCPEQEVIAPVACTIPETADALSDDTDASSDAETTDTQADEEGTAAETTEESDAVKKAPDNKAPAKAAVKNNKKNNNSKAGNRNNKKGGKKPAKK